MPQDASRLAQDMHNRASYQLLIPWLSLGHFSCLVPNLLVYISRLSYISSCIVIFRVTVSYIFVYSMHRRHATRHIVIHKQSSLPIYLLTYLSWPCCLHNAGISWAFLWVRLYHSILSDKPQCLCNSSSAKLKFSFNVFSSFVLSSLRQMLSWMSPVLSWTSPLQATT